MVDVGERTHLGPGDSPPARDVDGERRFVDRDHVESPFLQVERHSACAAADVEHTPADGAHGPPLDRRPAPERGKVVSRVAGVDDAVVPFHDLLRRTALVGGEQDLAVRVLVGSEHGARLARVR